MNHLRFLLSHLTSIAILSATGLMNFSLAERAWDRNPLKIPSITTTDKLIQFKQQIQHPTAYDTHYSKYFLWKYNRAKRVPEFAIEYINKTIMQQGSPFDRANDTFRADLSIPNAFQSTLDDYKRSGFDRGHNVPASNHKYSLDAYNKTFILSNIAPQVGNGFNRHIWMKLENYARKRAFNERRNDFAFIITGSLQIPIVYYKNKNGQIDKKYVAPFDKQVRITDEEKQQYFDIKEDDFKYVPKTFSRNGLEKENRTRLVDRQFVQFEVIGASNVIVPTHFYKIIIVKRLNGKFELEAFAVENKAVEAFPHLNNYRVPINVIEKFSGHKFNINPKVLLQQFNREQNIDWFENGGFKNFLDFVKQKRAEKQRKNSISSPK